MNEGSFGVETTLAEIAAACGRSKKWASEQARRNGWPYRTTTCIGGTRRAYPLDALPAEISQQITLARAKQGLNDQSSSSDGDGSGDPVAANGTESGMDPANGVNDSLSYCPDSLWEWFERKPDSQKEKARQRLVVVREFHRLVELGVSRGRAHEAVQAEFGVKLGTYRRWLDAVKGKHRSDWLPALCPGHVGCVATAPVSTEAWEMFKGLYLDRSCLALSTCYRRVKRAAKKNGWTWPSQKTIERKVKNEIPAPQRIYLREGAEALDSTFPSMVRDRSSLHALQIVNGDGVEFHPMLKWPDGSINRAKVWYWQDVGTGKILAWRADQTENKDMLRLSVGDLVDRYGIPETAVIDNTTAAASKWLTGGIKNRYRWKIKDEDPRGIMVDLGIDVRFTLPAHGQSKPIERAFRDLRELIDKHPQWSNRGTQGRPIPVEEFLEVVEQEVAAHNAQTGRRGAHCNGRSFDQMFEESYSRATIRKATADQRRLWLLAAERVRAHSNTGAVVLGRGPQGENRYWCEQLANHRGEQIVVRFDPQRLQEEVHVYTLDGRYIGAAECVWRGGFIDTETARAYHRAKNQYKRHTKRAAEAQRRMNAATAAKQIPKIDQPDDAEASVVSLQFRSKKAVGDDLVINQVDETAAEEESAEAEARRENFSKKVAWMERANRNKL